MNKLKYYFCCLLTGISGAVFSQDFTVESVTSYPFPSELTAAKTGSKFALAINEKGKRNIYVGEGPGFHLKKITPYVVDDAQEITSVTISPDGHSIIFVRGGDHGAYDETVPRNPMSLPYAQKVQVMTVPFNGGDPVAIDEGDYPVISPDSKTFAYLKNDEVWVAPVDGKSKARKMFYARGNCHSISWSPDGKQLLFVSSRKDHSFIGIYTDSLTPLKWIAPAFARDQSPRWSRDGKQIVFVRRDGKGGKPDSLTVLKHEPWALWVADAATGNAKEIWKAPKTLRGSVPGTQGGYNLHWAAGNKIIYVSYEDGWPHIYSIASTGGSPLLLTKGNYMLEHIKLSTDGKWIVASANTGPDVNDLHRRHILKIPVDQATPQIITPGNGIESFPVITGDGKNIIMLSADAQRPAVVATIPFEGGKIKLSGEELIPKDFPSSKFVIPTAVSFKAPDGLTVHAQLFEPKDGPKKKPAVVFVHGGPERQMLLGWHYGDYYSNTYALNQYLVSQGFIVLSVNYRLGIGYGFEFHNPPNTWINGAAEYLDIKAAGEWLAAQPQVDSSAIGIYGGSYGGFLTALALGKDSWLFKAGVDIHGVHNMTNEYPDPNGEQAPDAELAKKLIWESSPVAWLDNWTSPVLLIHGDDDGNVEFHESIDLVKRFEKKGFPFESLVIPDETHHWMKYSNTVTVDAAVAEFLSRKLLNRSLKNKKVCIDPGHGGTAATDNYRVGVNGEREEWINLRVGLLLKKMLEEKGAEVMMTRTTDSSVELSSRAEMAVKHKADVFISIHHNATADRKVNFPIIYFHGAASENIAGVELGKHLGKTLSKYFYKKKTPVSLVSDYTVFPVRGAAVLRNSYGIPGLLAEASFFTNMKEEEKLKQEQYNKDEATAYAEALEDFFSSGMPIIAAKKIPLELPLFEVNEEADRMKPEALKWKDDFKQAKKLLKRTDPASLQNAYDLFTRSARSFPDSYLAKQCHEYRADILKRLKRDHESGIEKTRAIEYYPKFEL